MPGSQPGDQMVELSIRTPAADNDAQREAYEALRTSFAGFDPRS